MKKHRILVIDDDKSIRELTALALEPLADQVSVAASGEQALELLEQDLPTLALLDMMLPGMDGIETLGAMKKQIPALQVVMITAFGTVARAVEAMRLGAEDFVQKPFSPTEIREVVARALERRDLARETESLSYDSHLQHARRSIGKRRLDEAASTVRKAIGLEPQRPEAFNLLGECLEASGNTLEAQKNYRAALALDPTFRPANENLYRTVTSWSSRF